MRDRKITEAKDESVASTAEVALHRMKIFTFDPKEFAAAFETQGYVHVTNGVSKEFLTSAQAQLADCRETRQNTNCLRVGSRAKKGSICSFRSMRKRF